MSNALGELDRLPSHALQSIFRSFDCRLMGLFYIGAKEIRKNIFKLFTQIDSQFFFHASYPSHLRSITRMLEEVISSHIDSGSLLNLETVEIGFGTDGSFTWQESMLSAIISPLISLAHRLDNLRVCRIYWGSPTAISDLLPKMCQALRGCSKLEELSIWEVPVSRNLLESIMGLQSPRMRIMALPRSEFFPADYTYAEDVVVALEAFANKFHHVECLSLPGLRGFRLNFEVILAQISFTNLRSLDLPYWCNEHSVFIRAANAITDALPYGECRAAVSRFFNLPNLQSFTIDCKDMIVEAMIKEDHSFSNSWISSFCFNQRPVDHAWLVTDVSIDDLLPPLAMLSEEMERGQKKCFLIALRAFCMSLVTSRCSTDYAPMFCKLLSSVFVKKLCCIERISIFDDIVGYVFKDPLLAAILLPKGPRCLVEIVGAPSESHLELSRRQILAARILRSKDLLAVLGVDLRATDSSGNGVFHLATEPSFVIDAAIAGCDYMAPNKSGTLPIRALIQINTMRFNERLVTLILQDMTLGPLGYLDDLIDSLAISIHGGGDIDEEKERAKIGSIALKIVDALELSERQRQSLMEHMQKLGLVKHVPNHVITLTPEISSSADGFQPELEVDVDPLNFGCVEFDTDSKDENARNSGGDGAEEAERDAFSNAVQWSSPKHCKVGEFPLGLDAVGTIL